MSKKVDILQGERDIDKANIKTLINEKSALDYKLKEAQLEIKRLLANRPLSISNASEGARASDGSAIVGAPTAQSAKKIEFAINQDLVSNYLISVEELLRAVKSSVASNILVAMKSIVLCVRKLSENVDEFEGILRDYEQDDEVVSRTNSTLFNKQFEKLSLARNTVSNCLSDLISTAKENAKTSNTDNRLKAEVESSKLTNSITELVAMIKNIVAGTNDSMSSSITAKNPNNNGAAKSSGKVKKRIKYTLDNT